jgi:hypothetical protein
MMKLFHNYDENGSPANKASRMAGANMLAYGLISYLAVQKKFSSTMAMGWSLVPIVAHVFVRDVLESVKTSSYKNAATVFSFIVAICAASLISGNGLPTDVAAGAVLALIGSIAGLGILFPDEMMC